MDNILKHDVRDEKAVRGMFYGSGFFAEVAKVWMKEIGIQRSGKKEIRSRNWQVRNHRAIKG